MIPWPDHPALAGPLAALPGLGPARAQTLARAGLKTRLDVLLKAPASYQDRREIMTLAEAALVPDGTPLLIEGTISKVRQNIPRYISADLTDGTGRARLWFFQGLRWLGPKLIPGTLVAAAGTVRLHEGIPQMTHPEFWPVDPDDPLATEGLKGVFPVYEPLPGISAAWRREIAGRTLAQLPADLAVVPGPLARALGPDCRLDPLVLLRTVHAPPKDARGRLPKPKQSRTWRTLGLWELAFWRLAILRNLARNAGPASGAGPDGPAPIEAAMLAAADRVWAALGFEPSPEQLRVAGEILADLAAPRPMSRLLQGEVGAGKTAVAACAAAAAVASGRQAALMAPTDILAAQHLRFFRALGARAGFETLGLTGRTPAAERSEVLAAMASGRPLLVVGTQALISGGAVFGALGLAIIDEQHRFGVRQRLALRSKSPGVDLLTLTATPIPGSLAGILYGDTDFSSMLGTLPGRRTPKTLAFEGHEIGRARELFVESVRAGGQGFLICPRIGKGEADGLEDGQEFAQEGSREGAQEGAKAGAQEGPQEKSPRSAGPSPAGRAGKGGPDRSDGSEGSRGPGWPSDADGSSGAGGPSGAVGLNAVDGPSVAGGSSVADRLNGVDGSSGAGGLNAMDGAKGPSRPGGPVRPGGWGDVGPEDGGPEDGGPEMVAKPASGGLDASLGAGDDDDPDPAGGLDPYEGGAGDGAPAAGRPQLLAAAARVAALAPDLPMGVLHGRMGAAERAAVMERFRLGSLKILAATTMVEVGVDIPAANAMLVEGAEYFGLAQLHQLRGRIGRGGGGSLFLAAAAGPGTDLSRARLEALAGEGDGYALAELDLRLRGPGEELGLRQSGWPRLRFARLPAQADSLPDAMALAEAMWAARGDWPEEFAARVDRIAEELARDADAAEAPPAGRDGKAASGRPAARGRGRPRRNPGF